MKSELFALFSEVPPISTSHVSASAMTCKICGAPAPFYDVTDFNKCAGQYRFGPSGIAVPWHRCSWCDFLFTPFFDDWTPDDFSRFVYNADYIHVDPDYVGMRPVRWAEIVAGLVGGEKSLRILDYGSGAGLLAKHLRERGVTVVEYDPFSHPTPPSGRFDIITCLEVIEHSPDPVAVMSEMAALLADGGCIVLSESLQPPNIHEMRANWWYCAPRNGHCSTFSAFTLARLAERVGLAFHAGTSPHALRHARGRSAIAERIGPAIAPVTLLAPSDRDDRWHGVEDGFRWTARDEVLWNVPAHRGDCTLHIRVPYALQVEPRFAERSVIRVGSRETAVAFAPDVLRAVVRHEVMADTLEIALRTPPLVRPADRGEADGRALGLAVRTLPHHWNAHL